MFRSIFFIAAGCFAFPNPADVSAAEITVWDESIEGKAVIQIDGPIASGDEDNLRQISREHPSAFVVLRSNGGEIRPALEMGRLIRLAGYETVVGKQDSCASACALIWAAGSTRWLSDEGRVGFHASYRNEDGKLVESGVANALIGHYLTVLGYPSKAVVFGTSASPTEILWLTKANSPQSGFSFERLPTGWGATAARGVPSPPAIVIRVPPSKPDASLNWMWGHQGRPQKFEFTNSESGAIWHVTAPTTADRNDVLDMVAQYADDRWIEYAWDGNGTKYLFDVDSLTVTGSTVNVWIRHDHGADKTTKYRTSKSYLSINCSGRRSRTLEGFSNMPDGSVVDSFQNPSGGPYQSIPPETVDELLWETVCWERSYRAGE